MDHRTRSARPGTPVANRAILRSVLGTRRLFSSVYFFEQPLLTSLRTATLVSRGALRRPPSRPLFSHPRGGGVERRQAHSFFLLVARVRGATPALVRRGPVPVRPGPLSALHRAIFGRGPTLASPAVEHRSRSDCPRQAVLPGGRGPDLPRCGFAPQSRDATPGSVRRSSPETSPPEPGWEFCTINSLRSQYISSLRSRIRSQQPRSDRPRSLFRLDPA